MIVRGATGSDSQNCLTTQDERLKRACKQFEGIFMAELLKQSLNVSQDEDKDGRTPFKALEETTIEMTAEAIAQQEGGGIGLWKVVYESLKGTKTLK